MVEQHHSVLGDLQRVLVSHVATTIRDFVDNFEFAESIDWKTSILEAFEDCLEEKQCQQKLGIKSNGFLSRFRRRSIPAKTDKCWKELSIFLWKAHQDFHMKQLSRTGAGHGPPVEV